jgi:DNA-directed RNA polymerase subunit L
MEKDLEIIQNGTYNNINLKTKYQRQAGKFVIKDGKKVVLQQGLDDGDFIIVKKHKFAEGKEIIKPTYTFFNCNVLYKDKEVSFIVYEKEHVKFASCGGIGDDVKITLKKELGVNAQTGVEQIYENLYFEKV